MIIKKLIKSNNSIPIINQEFFSIILKWTKNCRNPIEEYRLSALTDPCITDNTTTIIIEEFIIKLIIPDNAFQSNIVITKKYYKTFINNNIQFISEEYLTEI